jgi:hypothetical protein
MTLCMRVVGGTVFASLALCAASSSAEPIVALTVNNQFISFDSATPASVSAPVSVSGLMAGDTLVGIDFRPSLGTNNGKLYGMGVNLSTGSGRIYTLDPTSGVATAGAALAADPADTTAPFPFTTVMGTQFGVDFNPMADRLRVTSTTGQNLRINVDTGLVQLDGPLAYLSGDPRFGLPPVDVAVAYSNNFGGATSTVLRGVDISGNPDVLVTHTNPNGGTLTTTLGLPFNATLISYDISGITGLPYFAVTSADGTISNFFTAGAGGALLIGPIGGGAPVVGIAAQVGAPVPEPGTMTLLGLGLLGLAKVRRRMMATSPAQARESSSSQRA